jgi:hypothetical protein
MVTRNHKKALITITTCNRIHEIKKYILNFIDFCNRNSNFDFLLSLDGQNSEYVNFCRKYHIPLLHSIEREGVGISKNRVLNYFPNYDYYFFLEDDVELINPAVFNDHILMSEKTGIPHFSLSHLDFQKLYSIKEYDFCKKGELGFAKYGGAVFNFYTRNIIQSVGGWHPMFAKYKRYGHTEHTYRIYNFSNKFSPFIFLLKHHNSFIWHDPPHVTKSFDNLINPKTNLFSAEEDLINKKIKFYPITTISAFEFNGYDMNYNKTVYNFLKKNKKKYPLVNGLERNKCLSEYYFYKFNVKTFFFTKMFYFFLSFIYLPFNRQIKHFIKKKLGLV